MSLITSFRGILLLQAAAAFAALIMAFIAQYFFLLHPCELCIFQRYPYAVIIIIAIVGAWRKPQLIPVLICVALFALDAGIAFYHAGVELDIFKGPDGCSNNSSGEQTLEEMRAAILNAPLVSCKQAMAYFLGISMAAWNGIYASFCASLAIIGAVNARSAR